MIELIILKEWQAIKVSDVGVLIKGINYKKHEARNTQEPGLKPILRANNINGNLNFEDLVYVPEKRIASQQYIERHDILFCMSSGSKHLVGKSSQAEKSFDGSYGAFCALFRPLPVINPRFVGYFFQAPHYRKFISGISKGTNINNLKREHILDIDFCLPTSQEQDQIVSSLEELLSDLDNAIENLKKAQEQLKVYRQAIFWKGFEGGFTGGAKGWKTNRISGVCMLIDGDRGKNYPKKHELLETGYCLFLSAKNVRPNGFEFKDNIFISKEKHEKLRSGTLQRGDVVITTRGTIGNVALYDESVPFSVVRLNSGMLILRSKTKELLNRYLATFLRSPLFVWQIRKRKSGTAQPQLPANVLGEFEIKIPPVDVQNRIIEETDSRLSICDQAELTIEENLMKAQSLCQSILKQAFEGKLTEQWRKDHKDLISGENSVEALFKKIKAEKEALLVKLKGKKKHD